MQHYIKSDTRSAPISYPAGFMGVISIDKTGENFHLIYDTSGCFAVHCIIPEEAKYKLGEVGKIFVRTKGIPHLVTHDAHTIHYPWFPHQGEWHHSNWLGDWKEDWFNQIWHWCVVTRGVNLRRTGVVTNQERHPGSFNVVHVKEANGHSFSTWLSKIFSIGKGNKPWNSLPCGKGICLTIAEERGKRLEVKKAVDKWSLGDMTGKVFVLS